MKRALRFRASFSVRFPLISSESNEEKVKRCFWITEEKTPDFYLSYHDEEWGIPLHSLLSHFNVRGSSV